MPRLSRVIPAFFLTLAFLLPAFPLAASAPPNPSAPGEYTVHFMTYGSGDDLHRPEYGENAVLLTPKVDASALLPAWQGKSGRLRTKYWGFGPDRLPLNGRVWYPAGRGPFPLVLMVHGNHYMKEFSDPGYAYLGELLASRGFIFVSVDENFLNGDRRRDGDFRGQENLTRAWLLLHHLRVWREWQSQEGNPFYGRVDLDNIALMGHSRGGEAAAIAAALNRLERNPENALIPMDFGFGIKSVLAFAPADGQYKPGGKSVTLRDLNYLVLQGSHDADVSLFLGSRQYRRAGFTGRPYRFKSSLYIERANHGQFNTVWGRNDIGKLSGLLLDLRPLLSGEDQRRIAKVYASAFLEATLRGKREYLPLFRDPAFGAAWLPVTTYINQFEDSDYRAIADFDEDIDVTTATLPGCVIEAQGLTDWREPGLSFRNGLPMENTAVILGWSNTGSYTLSLPEGSLCGWPPGTGALLAFSLAESRNELPSGEALDLTVEVEAWDGRVGRVALSSIKPLPRAIPVRFAKSERRNKRYGAATELVFQRYEIPLAVLGIDLPELSAVRFRFDRSAGGAIALDDIGLRIPSDEEGAR